MNKASGGDGIPVELFQILKDDAVKVLHSICQHIWKTQQWPQDWKRSVFIPSQRNAMPKNAQTTAQLHSSHTLVGEGDDTPVLSPGKPHGRRSLLGCSPWGHKESDTTERVQFHFSFHALEKEMATHSNVLAWRIPGKGEPGGLPSMESHRVGHD